MILFYVRHGNPIYDPDSLTPLGERQAEAVAKRLALFGVDRIFASTSRRAIQTAQPTAELMQKDITKLDFCHEDHAWQEFTVPAENGGLHWVFHSPKTIPLLASKEMRELGDRWYDHPAFSPYREKFKQGVERIDREADQFLLSLGYRHIREKGVYEPVKPSEERVALFAHQGFGLYFLSSILDLPYPEFCVHFDMCHTGMTVIEWKEISGVAVPKALTVSDDSHLYREGLPTFYNQSVRF